jgi:uncharacterized Zn finger protein (UPF0148 family)
MISLKQRYTEYNDRLKASGARMLSFNCPACSQSIETQAATKGDTWDTLSTCPHCEALFMKITTYKTAKGLIPRIPGKTAHQATA